MNLYTFNSRILALLRTIEDGGELTAAQVLEAVELEKDAPKAIEQLCRLIRETSLAGLSARGEAGWFTTRARQQDAAQERFKAILLDTLNNLGIQETAAGPFNVRVQASPARVETKEGFDPKCLVGTPLEFMTKTEVKLLSAVVLEYRKKYPDDVLPEGIFVTRGEHVRIAPR